MRLKKLMNNHVKPLLSLTTSILLLLLVAEAESTQQPPFSCDPSNQLTKSYPFCKSTLPVNDRAKDLVSRLTLAEKISQLVNTAAAVPRLGIPAYEWWSEALHGVAEVGGGQIPQGMSFTGKIRSATSFPQVILSSASFDVQLWYRIGQKGASEFGQLSRRHSKPMKPLSVSLFAATLLTTVIICAESTRPPFSCDSANPSTKSYPFCKTAVPINLRARDLVSRLTLEEKISQLVNTAPAIPRLGVPDYQWWSEALHGIAGFSGIRLEGGDAISSVTSFPQVILTGATFDEHLWYRIGQAIGTEARAIYNAGQASGMTFWAPNINVFRDPRWGRGQETPGEDPLVSGKYAVSYVRGIQGDSFEGGALKDGHLRASACCKHFTAYDLDRWNGVDRYEFNAIVSKQDMADTYQPPFESCVEKGKASGIMCAYNRVNGIPNCADRNLLTNIARRQWGFQGYIVSDCDAVSIIRDNHKYARLPEDAVADVLKAGMDVNCGSYLKNYTKSAVDQKKVPVSQIDRALRNLFAVRMRLGLFNGDPSKLLYGKIGSNQVCTKAHQDLALEAARNGIVLLKNLNKGLPLSKTRTTSLAVIGPNANVAKTLQGNYEGPPCKSISPLQALQTYVKDTIYHSGCNWVNCTSADIGRAVEIAKTADHVVLIMGLDQTIEREDHDREDLGLPGNQQKLISSVAKAAKRPVVLVLICGGPVDVSFAKKDPKIGSILWAGYPGESGAIALAEIIFGEHNPGGKLPVTWYPKEFIKVPMTDMRMRPGPNYPGRTYRFYQGRKVFEFGYGLSYTKYSYKFASVTQNKLHLTHLSTNQFVHRSDSVHYMSVASIGKELCNKATFSAFVGVENQGEMDGKHPVLLFVRRAKAVNGSPMKQLVGFKSVMLKAGERVEMEFVLNPCEHLSRANEDGLMVIEEGSHFLVVGDEEYPISIEV